MNVILVPLPKEGRDSVIAAAIFSNVKDVINLHIRKKQREEKQLFREEVFVPENFDFQKFENQKNFPGLEIACNLQGVKDIILSVKEREKTFFVIFCHPETATHFPMWLGHPRVPCDFGDVLIPSRDSEGYPFYSKKSAVFFREQKKIA